ncbi:maleylacetoacetate isomerase [Radicibacter daui]|uniref:maleylacetoacetate isomerase n=1 Tax=Radicibacter daui TaxID=3064829 RepID=UPI004046DAA6
MKLYLNEISSATSRVRVALALKDLKVETVPVGILGAEAESRQGAYRAINPQGLVPALATEGGELITQSLAIIEYLDELRPEPALLPARPEERAHARAIALAIGADTHPLLTPRVALQLGARFAADGEAIGSWCRHWIAEGLGAAEKLIASHRRGPLALDDQPTLADIFLFPQAISARRAGLALAEWPTIAEVVANLEAIPAFADNAPAARK